MNKSYDVLSKSSGHASRRNKAFFAIATALSSSLMPATLANAEINGVEVRAVCGTHAVSMKNGRDIGVVAFIYGLPGSTPQGDELSRQTLDPGQSKEIPVSVKYTAANVNIGNQSSGVDFVKDCQTTTTASSTTTSIKIISNPTTTTTTIRPTTVSSTTTTTTKGGDSMTTEVPIVMPVNDTVSATENSIVSQEIMPAPVTYSEPSAATAAIPTDGFRIALTG